MKTKIKAIRTIKNDSKGNTINLTVIETTNGKPSIVRRAKEFLQDLKNSYLIDENVVSIAHPQVREAIKTLRNGTVTGQVQYVNKGDKWTVTETSLAITNPNHPKYGEVSVGDSLEVERDGARVVDGFLELEQSMQQQAINANAKAYAMLMVDTMGAFDDAGDDNGSTSAESFEDIPTDIFDEATQGEPAPETTPEVVTP